MTLRQKGRRHNKINKINPNMKILAIIKTTSCSNQIQSPVTAKFLPAHRSIHQY